jgi:1-acyl-sn-glycerol-3-phosphate acyltransferase
MILSALRALIAVGITLAASICVIVVYVFPRPDRAYLAIIRFQARAVLAVCGIRVVLEGSDAVDFSKNHIFVANHASLFDIPVAIAWIPGYVRIVYRKDLERVPIFGWALHVQKVYIPINRGKRHEAMRSIEETVERISRGGSVLMFGEGTRTPDGKLQPFKRGPFNLAVKAGIPVVPLTINGTYRILPKGTLRIHPGTITLVVDRAIPPPATDGRDAELQLRDEVRAVIERHYIEQ